jgi:pimeloyl-ACP methyl ester carboxylesterase
MPSVSSQVAPRRPSLKRLALWLLAALAGLGVLFASLSYTADTDPAAMKALYGKQPSSFVTLPNRQSVHVQDQGPNQALAIVLLHGSNDSLHAWDGWVARLKDNYRIITLDLPGHGLTGPAVDGDYTIDANMRVVEGVVNAMGLGPFVLGGNGMGGMIAWNYALKNPTRLDALLLVDTAGAPLPDSDADADLPLGLNLVNVSWLAPALEKMTPRWLIARELRESVGDPASMTDAMIDRYWDLLRYPGNRAATAQRFAVPQDGTALDRLDQVAAPTLIIWGDQDKLIPVEAAAVFRERIPASELVIYPGVGHLPMVEAPEQTVADVITFLGLIQVRPPSAPGEMPPPVSDAATDPALMPAAP